MKVESNYPFLVNGKHRSGDIRFPLNKGFQSFIVPLSVSSTKKGRGHRWLVRSSGRRSTVFTFLFLKWLWDELTSTELQFLFNTPEFFKEPRIESSFRARAYGTPKKKIRERLNKYLEIIGQKPYSHERYRGMKGLFLMLEMQEVIFVSPKPYSGYTRHYKDKGSLGSEHFPDETFTYDEKIDKFEFFFHLLSVGEIITASGIMYILPDDDAKKHRNGNKLFISDYQGPLYE
jgi:hypothetical protein